jgi:sec-independent protein translocase protein TatC
MLSVVIMHEAKKSPNRRSQRLISDVMPSGQVTGSKINASGGKPDVVSRPQIISAIQPSAALQATEKKPNTEDYMSAIEHIHELRSRLIWCVAALMFGSALGYVYRHQVIDIVTRPLGEQLYFSSPTGGFDFLVKVCLSVGLLITVPVMMFNLVKFIGPAIPRRIAYRTSGVVAASIGLAFCGGAFAYFVCLPAALHFLTQFSSGQLHSIIFANEYFSFVMLYVVGFAVLFQMPLLLLFINKITPLSPRSLIKKQRVIILASFVIAAILTPTPDPFNQTLMAAPIIGLYQTSVGVVWQSNRRSAKRFRRQTLPQEQAIFA